MRAVRGCSTQTAWLIVTVQVVAFLTFYNSNPASSDTQSSITPLSPQSIFKPIESTEVREEALIKYALLATLTANPRIFYSRKDLVLALDSEMIWLGFSAKKRADWLSFEIPCGMRERGYSALVEKSSSGRDGFNIDVFRRNNGGVEEGLPPLDESVSEEGESVIVSLADRYVQCVLSFLKEVGAETLREEGSSLVRDGRLYLVKGASTLEVNGSIRVGEMWPDRSRAILNGFLAKSGLTPPLHRKFERVLIRWRGSPESFNPDSYIGLKTIASKLRFAEHPSPRKGVHNSAPDRVREIFGLRGEAELLDLGRPAFASLERGDLELAEAWVKMGMIHDVKVCPYRNRNSRKKVWYLISGEVLPPTQSSLATRLNKSQREIGLDEKLLILGKKAEASKVIGEILRDPEAEVYAALDGEEPAPPADKRVKMVVFKGEKGDFRQLEGIIKTLKALKEEDVKALLDLYELLTGSPFGGEALSIEEATALGRVLVFTLPPVTASSYAELSKLNDKLLANLTSP